MSDRWDFEEDLYVTVRELLENFGVPASSIRRMINRAIRAEPWSADLRSRVLPAPSRTPKSGPGAA